jgi:hypothetical protein
MLWIDGEYFEPIWFDSLSERNLNMAWEMDKLKAALVEPFEPILRPLCNGLMFFILKYEKTKAALLH